MKFRDLQKQYKKLQDEIDSSIKEVCVGANFISGPAVPSLEKELAEYVGVKHCITCANGTEAITLALKAWGIGEGDAVFVPDLTFFSTGESPAFLGCTCIFVDVDKRTYNIDPSKLEVAIKQVIDEGKVFPKAIIAVDLYGYPAEYEKLRALCDKYGLLLMEDAAQGFGGEINGKKACSFGDISTTSFFPAKPLGGYGDGGAVFTDNDNWADLIRSYAVHGKSLDDKYNNIRIGVNSRLDTIQAAILRVKLKAFQDYELDAVNKVADLYNTLMRRAEMDKQVKLPFVEKGKLSSWAQYTIQLPEDCDRETLQESLKEKGIPTMVYYPKPMHKQGAFEGTLSEQAECPVTEALCKTVLSLPIGPYMTEEEVRKVVKELKEEIKKF